MKQLDKTMADYVSDGALPGLVSLVGRGDDVQVEVRGNMDLGGRKPMRRDSLFRITSMTKPIAATTAMILIEEGIFALDDPIDEFIPELADRRVLSQIDGPLDDTVLARRSITVRDLLTFRMGFGFAFDIPGDSPILEAERELEIRSLAPPTPPIRLDPDEWVRRLGTLPLMEQPGERWMYQTGSQVLGILIARSTGKPLEDVLRQRVFEPLGMTDTSLTVPPGKRDRFVDCVEFDEDSQQLAIHDGPEDSYWNEPPAFPDASAGLVSTVDDYHAFGRMLLNGGVHEGERILSEASVRAMTSDQITPEQKARSSFFPAFWDTQGWGLGLSIVTAPDEITGTPGRFGWGGGYGTSWYSDPNLDLVGVLMTQRMMDDVLIELTDGYWKSVYRSIEGEDRS